MQIASGMELYFFLQPECCPGEGVHRKVLRTSESPVAGAEPGLWEQEWLLSFNLQSCSILALPIYLSVFVLPPSYCAEPVRE